MAYRDPYRSDPYLKDSYGLNQGRPDPYGGYTYDPTKRARESQIAQEDRRIKSSAAGTSEKSSTVLNQLAPVPNEMTPQDEQGLLSSAGEATIGGLAALGNTLDIPGSMIRDTLALENPFDQLLPWNWTTHKGRVTGRELLTKYGLTKPNDPNNWEGSDFAGFGAEVALDPLSWFSFGLLGAAKQGLTAGGKIVGKMGKLSTLSDVAAQLPKNIGRKIGPREAKRMTLREFLNDKNTYLSMAHGTGPNAGMTAQGAKRALLNQAQEIAGHQIKHVRKMADELADTVAGNAGSDAYFAALRSGADDVAAEAAMEAAERAARDIGGVADKARKKLLREGGKDIVKANLDKSLGGDLQLGVPFGPSIGRPINIAGDKLARGLDTVGRYAGESKIGQVAATAFDSSVGGKFGKYAQQAMRLSSHYKDANASKVYKHIQGLSHGMDETKSVFDEFFGDEIGKWHTGIDPATVNREMSIGDILRTEDMGANGRLMGVDANGDYILRVENPENGAWEMLTKTISDPVAARTAIAGSEDAAKFSDALVEDALNSFMNASAEVGFDRALDSWFIGDVFDRLGYSGTRGKLRLIDRTRPPSIHVPGGGTAKGLKDLSPEQFGRLEETVNTFTGKAHRAADSLRDDLVARGVPIGDVYDEVTDFMYYPRRATPETLERMGHQAVETNFLGDIVGDSAKSSDGKVRNFSFLTDTALGRTQATANVPRHVVERMYKDERIIAINNIDEALEYADDAGRQADIEEIAEIITADHEYSKYLDNWSPSNHQEYLNDIAGEAQGGNGLSKANATANARSRHALEIAESVAAHRGHGRVYMPDMVTTFAKHASQMANKRSLLDGAFVTLATAARQGAPESSKGATVFSALRALGLDATTKKKLIKSTGQAPGGTVDQLRNIYGGESLKNLARVMGIPATEKNIRRLAEMRVDPDLVNQFAGTHFAMQPKQLKSILSVVDQLTAMFKSNVTLPFASFGMRNLMSGQFVNVASGEMHNAKDMLDYLKAVNDTGKLRAAPNAKQWRRWVEEIQAHGFVEGRHHFSDVPKIGAVRPAFAERGLDQVTPGGFFRGEDGRVMSSGAAARTALDPREWPASLKRKYSESAEHVAAHPNVSRQLTGQTQEVGGKATLGRSRSAWRTGLGVGSDFNRHIEFTNRVPMYIYLRRKGFSSAEAASRVRDLQFDYGRLAPFEKQFMRRAVPFYAFTRKMAPLFLTTLAERPGGLMGMTIRGSRLASEDKGAILPEYIGGQTTLPSEWLGMKPQEEGALSFVTGLGLAHEDPISYLGGLGPLGRGDVTKAGRRTFSEMMSRTNPLVKGPLEYLTGHSFFQTNSSGTGRALDDMDPVLGRLAANARQGLGGQVQHGKPDPLFGSSLLEAAVSSSPLSRYATTARQLTDPRKGLGEKAVNFLTGLKTTTLSPYQQDYAAKQAFEGMAKEGGYGGDYTIPYIDRYKLLELYKDGRITKEEFDQGLQMQGYYKHLQKKRKGGREEDKLRRLDAIRAR